MIHSGMDPTTPTTPTTRTIPTIHHTIVVTLRPLNTTTAQQERLGVRAAAVILGATAGKLAAIVVARPVRRICRQGTGLHQERVVLLPQPALQESQREEEVRMVFVVARRETQPSAAGDRIAA